MNAIDLGKEPIEKVLEANIIEIRSSDEGIDKEAINDLEHSSEGLSSMTSTDDALLIEMGCTETDKMDINELSLTTSRNKDYNMHEDVVSNTTINESESCVQEEKASIESSHLKAVEGNQVSSNGLVDSNESNDYNFDSYHASSPLMYPPKSDTSSSLEPKDDLFNEGENKEKNEEHLTSFGQQRVFQSDQVKHIQFENSGIDESLEDKKEDFDELAAGYSKGCPLFFLGLPNDSMHAIASFLLPSDLVNLSCASKIARQACLPIFTTVRMHGFRCAIEIVSTWLRGEHADARELVALYVSAGIPIYPPCYGHAHHTIAWRMSTEVREMEARNSPENEIVSSTNNNEQSNNIQLDRFFADRYETRVIAGFPIASITYLEEKCLFWRHVMEESSGMDETTRHNVLSRNPFYDTPFLSTDTPSANGDFWSTSTYRRQRVFHRGNTNTSNPELPSKEPKMTVKIHRHLADQHFLGHPSVEDEVNGVHVGAISLSNNFFHPQKPPKHRSWVQPLDTNDFFVVNDDYHRLPGVQDSLAMSRGLATNPDTDPTPTRDLFTPHDPMFFALPILRPPVTYTAPSTPNTSSNNSPSILSDVALEIYDSTFLLEESIRKKFDYYQKKLESCVKSSSHMFSEHLADFWDDFFPHTKGILFFNKHTPVPRRTKLYEFLTKPCPKAIGIVQCEIERIRSPPKTRKDVKGRLFPNYEYRLFIQNRRNRSESNEHSDSDLAIRKKPDTVIMTAKNKGRNHHGNMGGGTTSKRGVNNYYLYMATQKENEIHNASTQQGLTVKEKIENMEQSDPVELGRLQSNFIGTEFQIFAPSVRKSTYQSLVTESESEIETDVEADSGLKQRRGMQTICERKLTPEKGETSDNDSETKTSKSGKQYKKKSSKKKTLKQLLNPRRRTRRVTATVENTEPPTHTPIRYEDEDGSITYTANLLGNRPRIMEVCIPQIPEDGRESEWERYVRSCGNDGETNRMLNKFKQIQERLNNPDNNNDDENDPNDVGLLALQNRPPWWNVELGAFVLNFGGRVSVASVKNFQLCDRNDQDHIMLQFGRIQGRHSFTMDFQYPLTAMQAFAIAISSLQSKISLG